MSQVPPGSNPFNPWPASVQPPAAPPQVGGFGQNPYRGEPPSEPPVQTPRDTPDPGSPRRAFIWSFIAFGLIGVVMLFQQLGESAASAHHSAEATKEVTAPESMDQVRMTTSMMVRMRRFLHELSATPQDKKSVDTQLGDSIKRIDDAVVNTTDEFRAAIAAGELKSADVAIERIDALARDPDLFATYEQDRDIVKRIYAGEADALTSEERDGFVTRHGYFAKLALSYNKPDTDAMRDEVTGKGGQLIAALGVFGLILVFAFFAGITCCIIACVKLGNGELRPRFLPPLPGGSVFIELVAMLAAGFLFMKLVGMGLAAFIKDPQTLITVVLLFQWGLAAICFYPLLRGVSFADLRRRIGWTSGQGVVKEIGAGLFAYFAFLPVFVVGAVVALLLLMLWAFITSGKAEPDPASNPIADIIAGTSGFTLLLLFSLATIWAPLVEESVFRGALFRHLRSRMGLFGSAAISAVCFGVMHGYPFILLLPVTLLGFNFALMREWRGSLIAPITAHFLHNATILTFAITFFGAVG